MTLILKLLRLVNCEEYKPKLWCRGCFCWCSSFGQWHWPCTKCDSCSSCSLSLVILVACLVVSSTASVCFVIFLWCVRSGFFFKVLLIREWLAQCLGLFKGEILSCTECTQTRKQCCAECKDSGLPCHSPVHYHSKAATKETFSVFAASCCTRLYFIHQCLGSAPAHLPGRDRRSLLPLSGSHCSPASVSCNTGHWRFVESLPVLQGLNALKPFGDSPAFQSPQ